MFLSLGHFHLLSIGAEMKDDILINNVIIIDGTGKTAFRTNILIHDDKIEEIGIFKEEDAAVIVDARDLIVAPGFIDCHTHLGFFFPSPRHGNVLKAWAHMGVTTIVAGNCGYSPAPINHEHEENISVYWNFALPNDGLKYEWDTMGEYFDFLKRNGQAYNVAILTGHNTLRTNVMGFQARFAGTEEIKDMKESLRQSLEEGSIGLSLGLGYVPGIYSHTDELMELASVLTDFKAPIVPHTRGLGGTYDKAIEEVIKIAEKNHIPLHISHEAGGGFETREKIIQLIKEARDRGIKISSDNMPWGVGPSTAFILCPPSLFDGGVEKFYERLQDADIREKAIHDMQTVTPEWPNWEHDYWTDRFFGETPIMHGFKLDKNRRYNNMTLKDIADELNKTPIDAFIDLVLEERKGIFFTSSFDTPAADAYMATLISDPHCSIMTDAIGFDFNSCNPVPYGAFTKVLGKWVREEKKFTLEDAIYKMTSLPAQQMQLEKRGVVEKGNFADITIFNPKTVDNRATFETPFQLSVGIEYVLINGKMVLEQGKYNDRAFAGKVLNT